MWRLLCSIMRSYYYYFRSIVSRYQLPYYTSIYSWLVLLKINTPKVGNKVEQQSAWVTYYEECFRWFTKNDKFLIPYVWVVFVHAYQTKKWVHMTVEFGLYRRKESKNWCTSNDPLVQHRYSIECTRHIGCVSIFTVFVPIKTQNYTCFFLLPYNSYHSLRKIQSEKLNEQQTFVAKSLILNHLKNWSMGCRVVVINVKMLDVFQS